MINKTLRRTGALLALALCSLHVQAQTAGTTSVLPNIPTSPQAEAIAQHGNIHVNPSTGTPDISIPLFDIEHHGYTLPVKLSYVASPMKPGYNYDVYGHGWSLSVASCISRSIGDYPDEKSGFELQTGHFNDRYELYENAAANYNTERDKFHCTLPDGSSFDFVIQKENGSLRYIVSDVRSVIISCSYTSSNISSFTVTDEKGVKYTFTGADTPYAGTGSVTAPYSGSYVSWQLTSITLPHSSQTIQFTYGKTIQCNTSHYFQEPAIYLRHKYVEAMDHTYTAITVSAGQHCFHKMKLLTGISYGGAQISLTYTNSSATAEQNRVSSIVLKDNGSVKRTIDLGYSTQNISYPGGQDQIGKLTSVTLYGSNSTDKQVYKCTYQNMTTVFSGTDHWGNLNLGNVQSGIAFFNVFADLDFNNGDFIPVAPITELTKTSSDLTPYAKLRLSTQTSDNRQTESPTVHGVLKRITYPTGGYTELQYELHRFLTSTDAQGNYIHNKASRRMVQGGGFRIARIADYDTDGTASNIRRFAYGKDLYYDRYTGYGEAVADPNALSYLNCSGYQIPFPLHYMALGLNPNGQQASFSDPLADLRLGNYGHSWEMTFSAANFRRLLDGRPAVLYPQVTEYYGDITESVTPSATNTSGKTMYYYKIYDTVNNQDTFFEEPVFRGNSLVYDSRRYRYHQLTEKRDYVYESGTTYRMLSKETYNWNHVFSSVSDYPYSNPCSPDWYLPTMLVHEAFINRTAYLGGSLLTGKTTIRYDDPNYGVTTTEGHSYNGRHQRIQSLNSSGSHGQTTRTDYTYPVTGTGNAVIEAMVQKNIISPVLEEKTTSNLDNAGGSTYANAAGKKTEYGSYTVNSVTMYLPKKIYGLNTKSGTYELETEILSYSSSGNPREAVGADGMHTVYLWGYGDRCLIAEIRNATSSQVSSAVSSVFGMTVDALASATSVDSTKLASLRNNTNLSAALVTVYTHDPLVGVTSITDPSGKSTGYSYDALGRLKSTTCSEGTVETYDYNLTNN
jgi:YD repeat-containing protein